MCRSIIAEVLWRKHGRQHFEVQSFGIQADRVHYLVKEVLSLRGLNPNYSFSKKYEVIENQRFDIIILMHQSLAEMLPGIPYEYELLSWNFEELNLQKFEDPQKLKEEMNSLCDKIEKKVIEFVETYKVDSLSPVGS